MAATLTLILPFIAMNHSFLGHIRLHIDHFCYNPLRTIFSIVNNYNFKLVL